ncbi:hypothetical protein M0Q50_09560 [bacterium]|jgi:hypothetical protein|nr:hypothetical protein [bacterium]
MRDKYKTSRGFIMILGDKINWCVESLYADGTGEDVYHINVGPWCKYTCNFYPEKNHLYISGNNESISFECDFDFATNIVLALAKKQNDTFEGTIYDPLTKL